MSTYKAHVTLVYQHAVFSLTLVDKCAMLTDFSQGGIRQRLNIPHLDHRLREALKEGVLAASKPIHDGRRCCQRKRGRLEFLVGLKKATIHLEVCEVVIVEGVRCRRVEVI